MSPRDSVQLMLAQGGLLSSVLTSTNSWPNVLQTGQRTPWGVRACWFCGLIFALASVLTAASQSIRLHRISCRKDSNASIRALLSSKTRGKNGETLPRQSHVFIWQMSVIYLMCSIFIMIGGLFVLLWTAVGGDQWWDGQAKLAIAFSGVTFIVSCVFFWEQFTLFSWDGANDLGTEDLRLRD